MKINITLNLSKIDKSKIVERSYEDKEGNTVVAKEYKVELIELKTPKFVTKGDNWEMFKTHFVVEAQTKEEKQNKVQSNFVGDGYQFRTSENLIDKVFDSVEQDLSDVPF